MQSFLSLNPLGQVPQLAAQRRVHQAFRWLHLHDGLLMDWQRTLVGIPAPGRRVHVTTIYKICEQAAWRAAGLEGLFGGSPVDTRDGFIHFSTAAQVAETAAKHFAGATDLILVAVDAEALGPALKWEPSRGGALFPHLYAALPFSAVRWTRPLTYDVDGRHLIPELEP